MYIQYTLSHSPVVLITDLESYFAESINTGTLFSECHREYPCTDHIFSCTIFKVFRALGLDAYLIIVPQRTIFYIRVNK